MRESIVLENERERNRERFRVRERDNLSERERERENEGMKLKCEKERKIASVSKRENACYRNWVRVGELIRQSARERERVGYEWPCHNNKVRVTSKRLCVYCETSSGLEKFQERERER